MTVPPGASPAAGAGATEAALRATVAELERRLAESERARRDAVQELDALASSISHDLRAPIRHIGGYAELLHMRAGDRLHGDALRFLESVRASAALVAKLLDALLALSRVGRAELAVTEVPVDALAREVAASAEREAPARAVAWNFTDLPVVRADARLLRLALAHLVSNALGFTRGRQPARIEIAAEDAGAEWVFRVRDNGAGFEMSQAHRLFGVFQRLHAGEPGGVGTGLATVRRIVARHGGRIWAEGRPGEGATFWFSLPRAGPAVAATPAARPEDEP